MSHFTSQGREYHVISHPLSLCQARNFVADDWQRLSRNRQTHGFLSWAWVSTWLAHHPLNREPSITGLYVSRLYCDEVVVGITLLTVRERRVAKLLTIREGHVMRTGEPSTDQIWPEYIAPLVAETHDHASMAWLHMLAEQTEVEQLHMGVSVKAAPLAFVSEPPSGFRRVWESEEPGGYRTFEVGRAVPQGRRVRRMLAQTKRALSAKSITVTPLLMDDEWREAWSLLRQEHIRKWAGTTTPSGFVNPHFESFLHALPTVDSARSEGLMGFALRVDGELFGVTIGLREPGWFGFYLSAYRPVSDNRCRLGIYMHAAIMDWFAEHDSGRVFEYDFMAGEAEYKRQLSNGDRRYGMLRLYRPCSVSGVIEWARRLRNCVVTK